MRGQIPFVVDKSDGDVLAGDEYVPGNRAKLDVVVDFVEF